jgi:hypothetical protein
MLLKMDITEVESCLALVAINSGAARGWIMGCMWHGVVVVMAAAYVRLIRRFGMRLGEVSKDSVASLGLLVQNLLAMWVAYALNLTWL